MKKKNLFLIFFCLFFSVALRAEQDYIYQVSVNEALKNGSYDGRVKFGDLMAYGDTGIGTFDAFDGELIMIDGVCSRMTSKGEIKEVTKEDTSSFCTLAFLEREFEYKIKDPMSMDYFKDFLIDKMGNKNVFYVVRFDGGFFSMKVRSLPKQNKPYENLNVVEKRGQIFFDRKNVKGTMIGFYFPEYAKGINVPGFRFCFISRNKDWGGEVVDFRLDKGKLLLDKKNFLMVDLGDTELMKNLKLTDDTNSAPNLATLEKVKTGK